MDIPIISHSRYGSGLPCQFPDSKTCIPRSRTSSVLSATVKKSVSSSRLTQKSKVVTAVFSGTALVSPTTVVSSLKAFASPLQKLRSTATPSARASTSYVLLYTFLPTKKAYLQHTLTQLTPTRPTSPPNRPTTANPTSPTTLVSSSSAKSSSADRCSNSKSAVPTPRSWLNSTDASPRGAKVPRCLWDGKMPVA